MSKKVTTEIFILEAQEVHGDKYDYSKVDYKSSKEKVCIICHKTDSDGNEHGEFWLTKSNHIVNKRGCPKCKGEKTAERCKFSTEEWIEKVRKVHNDKYDYSKVNYINQNTLVTIICPEHGEFQQIPNNHIRGEGCPKCGRILADINRIVPIEEQLEKCREIHNNFYDYSLVTENTKAKDKIKIICPIHGIFEQTLNTHLSGCGCYKCGQDRTHEKQRMPQEEFINRCSEIHNNKYDYSVTEYKGLASNIKYICPDHGIIEQSARSHLINKSGCPKCSKSHGEKAIISYLDRNSIKYISEFPIEIDTSINESGYAYIDFYLPEYNIAIEFNGILHYKYVPYLHKGNIINFERQQNRDKFIEEYCKNNSIKLISVHYKEENNIENILKEQII